MNTVIKFFQKFFLLEIIKGLFLTLKTAECISLRISDVLEFGPTKESFIQAIGKDGWQRR